MLKSKFFLFYLVLTVLLGRWEDVSDWGRGGGEQGGRGDHPNLSHPQAVVQVTYTKDI